MLYIVAQRPAGFSPSFCADFPSPVVLHFFLASSILFSSFFFFFIFCFCSLLLSSLVKLLAKFITSEGSVGWVGKTRKMHIFRGGRPWGHGMQNEDNNKGVDQDISAVARRPVILTGICRKLGDLMVNFRVPN